MAPKPTPQMHDEAASEAAIAALAVKLEAAQAEERRLAAALADEDHDLALGVLEAGIVAERLRGQLAAQRRELSRIEGLHARAVAELARARAAKAEQAEIERRNSVPPLASRYMEEARAIETAAAELGALIRRHAETMAELATALNTSEAKRLLSNSGLQSRLMQCLASHFESVDTRPEEIKARVSVPRFQWFDWRGAGQAGPDRLSLVDMEQSTLDGIVTFYPSEAAAQAARARRDPTGATTVVLPVTGAMHKGAVGLWYLWAGRLRGTTARTQQPDPREVA